MLVVMVPNVEQLTTRVDSCAVGGEYSGQEV